jgi:hypothetical protein
MRVSPPSLRFLSAALMALAIADFSGPAAAQERVGVNAAVNTDANGTPPGGAVRRLVIGQEVVHNERITTDTKGQTQILFVDGSSISVGPNADLAIDEFVYDPSTGTGKMTLTAVEGAMRFVGGKLSKQDNAVSVHLGTATIGVRGGIFIADAQPSGSQIIFVYGKAVTVTGPSGSSQELYRPGFAVDVNAAGSVGAPYAAPPGATTAILTQLDGRAGSSGGARNIPTDATVAKSGVPNVISNDVAASVQSASQNTPYAAVPPTPTVAPQQIIQNLNTTSSQSQPFVANPLPPQPVVIEIAGLVKIAQKNSTLGFTNQSISGRIPYTGTITYPVGSFLKNGVATGDAFSIGSVFTLSPLTAGMTTNVTATATTANSPATGTATESADGDFFFANLTATNSGQQIFVFGGVPVQQSFYAATPAQQFYAFSVLPDATLGSGGVAQTIPFLPSFAGGTMANAVVSPLYVETPANTPFGAFNPITNPNVNDPHFLQASLAINGQGASQSSALNILTGSFFTSSDTGTVAASGPIRGTFLASGTSQLTHIGSGFATVPDANGNNLFGGSSLDGFVLDSNDYNPNLNFITSNANSFTIGSGSITTAYNFNQPVLSQTLPAGVGSSRSALSEQGFFGGIMTNGAGFRYALAGDAGLITNPASGTLFAEFAGTDPFTSNSSGIGAILLPFGTNSGRNFSRSTFIDNNIFAATESATVPVEIATNSGNTTIYPTFAGGVSSYPALGLVTSATVPGAANSLLPAGVSFCACQYLQWGYWEANIPAVNNGGPTNTVQSSFINTWIAGTPTVNLPTSGIASYNGAAIGTVTNNGAAYLAAGGFNNTYNFGINSGTVSINNFDGQNYSGTVSGGSGIYGGTVNGAGSTRTGSVVGQFYGPGAPETGGVFAVHATSGPSYIASGIFAGKQ